MSTLSPREFSDALVAVIPRHVLPKLGAVYLDSATQLHEAVVFETPVDTGYLRAGFQATVGDDAPTDLVPRDRKATYTPGLDGQSANAMVEAAKTLRPLTLGFVAGYAPYVEDRFGFVKSARGQWPVIVERAIRNNEDVSDTSDTTSGGFDAVAE